MPSEPPPAPAAEPSAQPQFQPVHRRSTTALICDQLRSAITTGTLEAGAQLSEATMAAQFGVSRGPLREAMQRLVQEGLLRSEPHRGLFVKELDEEEVRDLYTARTAVESAAARILAREASNTAIAELRGACALMHSAAEASDLERLSDADLAFHELLVRSSRSSRLHRMHETLIAETRMCLTALEGSYRDPREQVIEHSVIVDAIEAGAEDRIGEAIEGHMHQALERLIGTGRLAGDGHSASVPPD